MKTKFILIIIFLQLSCFKVVSSERLQGNPRKRCLERAILQYTEASKQLQMLASSCSDTLKQYEDFLDTVRTESSIQLAQFQPAMIQTLDGEVFVSPKFVQASSTLSNLLAHSPNKSVDLSSRQISAQIVSQLNSSVAGAKINLSSKDTQELIEILLFVDFLDLDQRLLSNITFDVEKLSDYLTLHSDDYHENELEVISKYAKKLCRKIKLNQGIIETNSALIPTSNENQLIGSFKININEELRDVLGIIDLLTSEITVLREGKFTKLTRLSENSYAANTPLLAEEAIKIVLEDNKIKNISELPEFASIYQNYDEDLILVRMIKDGIYFTIIEKNGKRTDNKIYSGIRGTRIEDVCKLSETEYLVLCNIFRVNLVLRATLTKRDGNWDVSLDQKFQENFDLPNSAKTMKLTDDIVVFIAKDKLLFYSFKKGGIIKSWDINLNDNIFGVKLSGGQFLLVDSNEVKRIDCEVKDDMIEIKNITQILETQLQNPAYNYGNYFYVVPHEKEGKDLIEIPLSSGVACPNFYARKQPAESSNS